MRATWVAAGVVALGCVLGGPSGAHAQASRTWVSGVGDDANPCSRTAPCKTFAGAISKTATGGEIDVLDPGGFGAVTITKAITIDGGNSLTGILAAGTNGVVVNAPTTARVVLRRLSIKGLGTGLKGIRYIAAHSLYVDDSIIEDFSGNGIDVEGAGRLFVHDTVIRNNGGTAIEVAPASGAASALVENTRMENNAAGLVLQGAAVATARGSTAAGNDTGFTADGAAAELSLVDSLANDNDTGVEALNGALVRFTRLTASGNATAGLAAEAGGSIVPFADNQVAGNPPGAAILCELGAASTAIFCPDFVPACAACPSCPAPVCAAPVVAAGIGPCKRCKTRRGVTTCKSCTIQVQ